MHSSWDAKRVPRQPAMQVAPGLPELLLWRSATISGFFLLQYASLYRQHLQKLISAWQAGKLHVALDSHKFRYACFYQLWAFHPGVC